MSKVKKRAFVRYSKKGLLVPGSLIVTNGSYPNGPSTWFEVPADLCCLPEDCCTPPPIVCNCYLLVNPDLGAEGFEFSYRECDGGAVKNASIAAGDFAIVCAEKNSIEKANGLLMSEEGVCTPIEGCATPEQICMTYYISNNTGNTITVSWNSCGSGATNELGLPPSSNTAICGILGTVSAPGATINLAVIGCA